MDSVSEIVPTENSLGQKMNAEEKAKKAAEAAEREAVNEELDRRSRPTGPWKCDLPGCNCGKAFPLKTNLDMHKGGRCWLCGKGFTGRAANSDRKKHERTHVRPEFDNPPRCKGGRCSECNRLIREEFWKGHLDEKLCDRNFATEGVQKQWIPPNAWILPPRPFNAPSAISLSGGLVPASMMSKFTGAFRQRVQKGTAVYRMFGGV